MLSTMGSKGLERAIASSTTSIPSFLLPAFGRATARSFSSSSSRHSHIGREPLTIPPGVNFSVIQPSPSKNGFKAGFSPKRIVEIEGPLGKMSMTIPNFVKIKHDATSRRALVTVEDREVKHQREMWGTTRAYLQNHILGVSEGHTAILRLVGVGYRATVEDTATTVSPEFPGQQFVVLKVGYSHPIELPVPKGVKASTPQPTRILLEGPEKEVLLQFAAEIRQWRKPEPYKGKGIFVNEETIKLKAKKIK
ncbi:mitochondrial 54S ribosomal protein YmL16 [Xylogone sp. PMI_703]|nr:mitochondrial 54S ribosomal protein YmL16 [Xylogone sp. PMI_703]